MSDAAKALAPLPYTDDPLSNLLIEKTKPYLKISDLVFDYGCEEGRIAIAIAGDVTQILAIDSSAKKLKTAYKRTAARHITNIEYAQAHLFAPRFQIDSFDVLLAFDILHLLGDVNKALAQIHNLLKPGGLFLSATPCKGVQSKLSMALTLLGVVPNSHTFTSTELQAMITQAHFEQIQTEELPSQRCFIAARKI